MYKFAKKYRKKLIFLGVGSLLLVGASSVVVDFFQTNNSFASHQSCRMTGYNAQDCGGSVTFVDSSVTCTGPNCSDGCYNSGSTSYRFSSCSSLPHCTAGNICQGGNVYSRGSDCSISASPVDECDYGCSSGSCNPPPNRTLDIIKSGSGSGTVTSDLVGINCGSDCTQAYPTGTRLILTANPDSGSTFAGWSGFPACDPGVGPLQCEVFLNDNQITVAQFDLFDYALDVSVIGPGTGTVTSNPAGINCGSDCSESYTAGTSVTLTAIPDPGFIFTGWGGACSGGGTCTITIDSGKNVSANFGIDTTGPEITSVSYDPSEPTAGDEVSFIVEASDESGIYDLVLMYNRNDGSGWITTRTCTLGTTSADPQVCSANLGPFIEGETINTFVRARDNASARNTSESDFADPAYEFMVAAGIDTTPPSIPTGVAVVDTTSSTVSLSWNPSTDNVGIVGYEIFRNGTKRGENSSRSFTDTGLDSSESYMYAIRAYDAAGNVSAFSDAVTATTGGESSEGEGDRSIFSILEAITDWLFAGAVVLLPFVILYAAYLFLTSGGNPERLSRAKNVILWGVIGFIIAILAFVFPSIIRDILGV